MIRSLSTLALLTLSVACAHFVPQEEEVIIVDPVLEEPALGPDRCTTPEDITGDGIGGTGCPADP